MVEAMYEQPSDFFKPFRKSYSIVKKLIKIPTGEKNTTSTAGNDGHQKRRYRSKRSVCPENVCKSEKADDEDNSKKITSSLNNLSIPFFIIQQDG